MLTRLLLLIADLCDRASVWCLRRTSEQQAGLTFDNDDWSSACAELAYRAARRTPLPTPPPDDLEGGLQSRTGGEKP